MSLAYIFTLLLLDNSYWSLPLSPPPPKKKVQYLNRKVWIEMEVSVLEMFVKDTLGTKYCTIKIKVLMYQTTFVSHKVSM